MPIPNTINHNHVLQALSKIVIEGVPAKNVARNTILRYEKKAYPTKWVICQAYIFDAGQEWPTKNFITHEAVRYLTDLGFTIEYI